MNPKLRDQRDREKAQLKRRALCAVCAVALALAVLAGARLGFVPRNVRPVPPPAQPGPPVTGFELLAAKTLASPSALVAPAKPHSAAVSATNEPAKLPTGRSAEEDQAAAFTAFSQWAEQFLAGHPSISTAQAQALAWQRREALLELIRTDPQKALAQAAPFAWRRALPAAVTQYFEQPVDGRGALTVAVATDFEHGHASVYREAQVGEKTYAAFVYGRRLRQVSQSNIPLHGIAVDGRLALQAEPMRFLAAAEAQALAAERGRPIRETCAVCGVSVAAGPEAVIAETGGELTSFCGLDHASLANERWRTAETAGPLGGGPLASSAANDRWTHGAKTVLYLRVNFPDDLTEPVSEARAYEVMDNVSAFYAEGSYDLTALDATVTPLLTVPRTKAYYATTGPGGLLGDARETARLAGYDTANYDLDIVCFTTVEGYDFGGLAFVHGKGVWLQSAGEGVTAHELGHNYGLWHANFWDTQTNSSAIGLGTNIEYGNIFDTMGSAAAGNNQFGAIFKNILDWLPDGAVQDASTNGVYRIYPFDVPSRAPGRFYATKVRKDFDRDYWLEFRQKFTGNPWLQYGVLLNWSAWAQTTGSDLIDTTPGTPTGSQSRQDAAVVIGRTFTDPGAGVHITPLARGATGTNAWIDVQINLGAFPSNQPPTLQLEVDTTNALPGALVHFHAAAADPDGDTLVYAWTFDDLSFSTNNLPWTFKNWNSSGEHVIRCAVSDGKGGVASANAVVTVGTPAGYRITGRVADTNGVPIEGVRVDNGSNSVASYLGGYTDSDGRFVIVSATGDLELNAVLYGFTFTNLTWTNPLSMTSDWANVDFIATPLPAVSIALTTNAIPENSPARAFFTLTRTGDTGTNLMIGLNLAGSAGIGSDYTLTPALTNGTNVVEFPPGSNSVRFAFQTINDTRVEGPETVTLTLLEDAAYVFAPLAEATLTILDDDLPALPAVSVSTPNPSIPERGLDPGQLVFSRTGNTSADLPVFYSVTGTATAGTDYATLPGLAVIPAGRSRVTIELLPIDDKDVEPDETVTVTINPNPTYAVTGPAAQITILDDDLLTVTVFPTGANAAEPSTPGRFTVKRDGDLTDNLLVHYTVAGTATSGVDYQALSGTVTIPAGATSAGIPVQPLDDDLVEGDESVILTLTTNAAYNIGTPGVATVLIRDNEKVTVTISAPDDSASEPGGDTGAFRVSRGAVTAGDLTVFLAISGTAINGVDYVPLDTTVTIPNGAGAVTLDLIPFDDLHKETNETVMLFLLPGTNYNVGLPSQATVTIADNDDNEVPAVGFSFSASSAPENQSPGVGVSLSATSDVPISVEYRVIGGTASSNDYTLPPGPLVFQPGERAKNLPLQIINDSLVEPNETIRLVLFNPENATLDGIKIHTYTILDDDTASVSVIATAPSAAETGPVPGNFRISRTGTNDTPLLVNYQITGSASAPGDYAPLGTSVTIPAGAAFVDLPVLPVEDRTVELNETVVLTLISAPGARIIAPNVATVTITDNDPNGLPVVTVSSTNQPYAVEGGANGEFVFSRTGPVTNALTVPFQVSGTAGSGLDYFPLPNAVTLPAGQASFSLPLVAVDDALVEPEETVVVALTLGDTYRLGYPASALVTIQDNDQRVRVDASDFIAAEPGTDTGEFTFSRFGTTNNDLAVFFSVGGTASNGVDYAAISNSITIPAGSLSARLPIVPLDDALVEGPETVKVTLQANPAYLIADSTNGTVIINDDEPMLTLTAPLTNIVEGGVPGVFRLTRTGDPKYDFTAHLAVGGTATFGVDYPPFETNVYFSCSVTAIDLLISATNELVVEGPETVSARLLPDPAYTILSPSNALITIEDAATNRTPLVTITSPTAPTVFLLGTNVNMILEAAVNDDSDTNTPVTLAWSKVSGPDTLYFGDTNLANTTVSFTNLGLYVLRLTADDGQLQDFAEVTVVVSPVEWLATNLLHWAMDEGSGTNVLDTSGAGRDGVFDGTPTWVTNGVLGGALVFAGTNDCVRQSVGTNFLSGLNQFSVSLWLRPAGTNTDQGIFCAEDASTNATLALYTKTYASCGRATNVLEATIPTSTGVARRISAADVLHQEWQHVTLTWSNGLAPALYLNGQLDQPLSYMAAFGGVLTNCPQFIVGKGPAGSPRSWNGWVDDLRVYPRALTAAEVAALAALPPTNYGAVVNAGPDATFQLTTGAVLAGGVTDDGKPNPPGFVSNTWSLVSGPGPVTFTNANSLTNTVQFTLPGEYVFRLVADDGQVKTYDEVTNTVTEPTLVNVFATDSQAAELGPDPGEFTFSRQGDLNFDLTVFLALSGTASNGADYIPLTNVVTFPAGTDTVTRVVTPFLDHRTEGDETVTFTILTNLAYTVGNGEATVTIADSPYGAWTVQHFTLEELTDPTLSGESADFDHDGLVNFAEYAINRDPKGQETNSPMATAVEFNPGDGQNHITLTYQRRVQPTDTGYAPAVSTDLLAWSTGPAYFEEIQAVDDGNGITETVTVRLVAPYPAPLSQFLTVRVWLQATGP